VRECESDIEDICSVPELFREKCGDPLQHAGCYPPSVDNPESTCTCFYADDGGRCRPNTRRCKERDNFNIYDRPSQNLIVRDLIEGDVLELNCYRGCIDIRKAMYYCDEDRGMVHSLDVRHLKIAKDICNGYERCAIQAIGGIFDVEDVKHECRGKQMLLWLHFTCRFPSKRVKQTNRSLNRLYGGNLRRRFEVPSSPGHYGRTRDYFWEADAECYGFCRAVLTNNPPRLTNRVTKYPRNRYNTRPLKDGRPWSEFRRQYPHA